MADFYGGYASGDAAAASGNPWATFGKSAEQIAAAGLSSNPIQAEMQIASGNWNPTAMGNVPIQNTATVGTSGIGARISDAQVQKILSGMESGTLDPKLGALQLSQGQVNLYDLARISGKDPAAIQAAAAQNGIRIQDSLGQNGVIQQGGLMSGSSLEQIANASGGRAMVNPNGTISYQERSQLGTPYHSDSYAFDLSRIGLNPYGMLTPQQARGAQVEARTNVGGQQLLGNPAYSSFQNYSSGNYQGQGRKEPAPWAPIQQPINQQSRMGNMRYGQQSMYPYQNYGRQGMFGGTATSRQPYTGYQAYQPYAGNSRNGMFGAPTMNYNMRNRPMQQYSQSWSQNNPYSFGGY